MRERTTPELYWSVLRISAPSTVRAGRFSRNVLSRCTTLAGLMWLRPSRWSGVVNDSGVVAASPTAGESNRASAARINTFMHSPSEGSGALRPRMDNRPTPEEITSVGACPRLAENRHYSKAILSGDGHHGPDRRRPQRVPL